MVLLIVGVGEGVEGLMSDLSSSILVHCDLSYTRKVAIKNALGTWRI